MSIDIKLTLILLSLARGPMCDILSIDMSTDKVDTVYRHSRQQTTMPVSFNIDRRTAARLLNVSLRTVDRYLKTRQLSAIKSNGRIWLSNADILQLSRELRADTDNVDMSTDKVDIEVDNINRHSRDEFYKAEVVNESNEPRRSRNPYRELYENVKNELEDRQKRLDQATYRVGQLEAQISSMVPLMEYKRQEKLLLETGEQYKTALLHEEERRKQLATDLMYKIEAKENDLKKVEHDIEVERFNKAVFAVILFIVLALQPVLWFVLK